MKDLVLGGTTFIGRRIVERLHERGDEVLVVHRGHHEPSPWVPVGHLHADRSRDPQQRVAESVRWHLAHPPETTWTAEDTRADEEALRSA